MKLEVILLERIKNLGNLGDKVKVARGYGRNYLIPYQKAVFASAENIELFEARRDELNKKAQQNLAQAEQRASELNDTNLVIKAIASEEGKLYGSIGPNEIKEALLAKDIQVEKREITMPEGAFRSVGDYLVEIHVHSDVIVKLKVQVVSDK